MNFIAETVIQQIEFNNERLEKAKQNCIEYLIAQTERFHKDLKLEDIREKVLENVTFTVFDTNKNNPFTDKEKIFLFESFKNASNCGVIAEYELQAKANR